MLLSQGNLSPFLSRVYEPPILFTMDSSLTVEQFVVSHNTYCPFELLTVSSTSLGLDSRIRFISRVYTNNH
jgi:hypothetical protein